MPKNPERASRQKDIFSQVKTELQPFETTGVYHARALPALRLYAYNFFTKHRDTSATKDELEQFRNTCRLVSEKEQLAAVEAGKNALSTIGAEIEWFIPQEQRNIIEKLERQGKKNAKIGIDSADIHNPTGPLWELQLPWTYNAQTQAFMVAQLRELGGLNPEYGIQYATTIPSMHLNYLIPENLEQGEREGSDIFQKKITEVNDLLILAFDSPARLRERKTHTSFTVNRQAEEIAIERRRRRKTILYRLELRAFGLSPDQEETEKLMTDSQYLVSGLFQWTRDLFLTTPLINPRVKLTFQQQSIVQAIAPFLGPGRESPLHPAGEASLLKQTYGIADNFADKKDQLNALLENPSYEKARNAARELVENTSSTIKDFIIP